MAATVVAIRHGKPSSAGHAADELRPLSAKGKKDMKRLADRLREAGIFPNFILTSPFVRARESAEVLSEAYTVPLQIEPMLGLPFDKNGLLHRIPSSGANDTLFLVGHAPTLADFINLLFGEDVLSNGLAQSSAAVISFSDVIQCGHANFIQTYQPD